MVITNQIEKNDDWEYIDSDIGIAIACVMESGKKQNITWDEEDHVYAPRALNTNKNHIIKIWQLLMMATNTNSKLSENIDKGCWSLSTNDWKYSDSGTDIGIAIAWVMKRGNKRDVKSDEDGQHAPTEESQ